MPRWMGRFAIDIEFDAADANEAREIAGRMADNPPTTWCGHPILGRTPYYFTEKLEPSAEQNQDTKP